MGNDTFEFEEENIFSDEEFKMVMSIVKRGFETEVLEAAKAAGHFGAFIMQAKGVSKIQRKFLGFSIDPENTVVMMLVKKELVVPVMKSIYSSVDFTSEARGMVFALPVSEVVGMRDTYDKIEIN
jgi:nitrogen regulatory protein PII